MICETIVTSIIDMTKALGIITDTNVNFHSNLEI